MIQTRRVPALTPTAMLAWVAVGIPILWGVRMTLTKVAVLFR
jgi:hypothetical protein